MKAKPRFHCWCYFSEGEESVVKSIVNNRKKATLKTHKKDTLKRTRKMCNFFITLNDYDFKFLKWLDSNSIAYPVYLGSPKFICNRGSR